VHRDARLAAIADTVADAAALLVETLGTRTLTVEDAMHANAVLIASPTPSHADYIKHAATRQRPVFCERPIDLSAPRLRACPAAVRQPGPPLMACSTTNA
jgi:myo-inositol 2-dehydrogenase / D-chiro-inositol 1-dehydrogenase